MSRHLPAWARGRGAGLTSGLGLWRSLALSLAVVLSPTASSAGIFDDDEARRAILEMRQQRTQDAESANARLSALGAQVDQIGRAHV